MTRSRSDRGVATFRIEAGLWALETSEAERYPLLDDAKRRLLQLARWHLALGALALPRSGWAIEGEPPDACWVWRIGTATSTLHDRLEHARRRADVAEEEVLLEHLRAGAQQVAQVAERLRARVPLDATSFTLIGGRCLYLGAPSADAAGASEASAALPAREPA